jgi:8-oxo-dGTP pyrophosphatase MutT (NUDIX family)
MFTEILEPVMVKIFRKYGKELEKGEGDWTDYLEEFQGRGKIGLISILELGCAEALMNLRAKALERKGENPHITADKYGWSEVLDDREIMSEFANVRERVFLETEASGVSINKLVDERVFVFSILPINEYLCTKKEIDRFFSLQGESYTFDTVPRDVDDVVRGVMKGFSNDEETKSYFPRAEILQSENIVRFCMGVLAKYPGLEKIARRWQSDPQLSNVTHAGDGYVSCEKCGSYHWGKNGAAGILVRKLDKNGRVSHLLLQLRSLSVSKGGTWGIPGGALSDGESELEGALREAREEANILPDQIEIVGQQVHDHGNWRFTTFFAVEKPNNPIQIVNVDSEAISTRWVAVEELSKLQLLHHFGDELNQALSSDHK